MFDKAVLARAQEHVRAARLYRQLMGPVFVLAQSARLAAPALRDGAHTNLQISRIQRI